MCMDRFLFQNRNIISCSTHQSFRYKPFSGFVGPVPSTSPAPALSPSPSPAPASTPSPHISYSSFTNTIPPLPHSSPSPSSYLQIHFLALLSLPVTHFWICSHLWLCSHFQRLNDDLLSLWVTQFWPFFHFQCHTPVRMSPRRSSSRPLTSTRSPHAPPPECGAVLLLSAPLSRPGSARRTVAVGRHRKSGTGLDFTGHGE